jgi:hypothetical protein
LEEDFPHSNLLQRGGKRQQEERRGCSGRQCNKMRLLLRNSNARWRRVFQRELLRRYSEFHREGNFRERRISRRAISSSAVVRERKRRGEVAPADCSLCGKSSSYCKSRAKLHPDGRHFEKI